MSDNTNNKKPTNLDEYKEWLKCHRGVEITERTQVHYEAVTNKIRQDFEKSDFWVRLLGNLKEYDSQYYLEKNYHLLTGAQIPGLDIKPFKSFLSKTLRKNVIHNKQWPNAPEEGWILPNNWYVRVNDIIRTCLPVKYLDGVEFITDKIRLLCEQCALSCEYHLEAREEGYYAAHLYTKEEFEIPRITWDTEGVKISIEIQITTQVQEVIRQLLHKYYEKRRELAKVEEPQWQWNYRSDEFTANYLGHILHYVEGMIMEIREKQKEEKI